MSSLNEIVGAYYDQHQAHLAAELPEEGRRFLRDQYISDILEHASRETIDHIRAVMAGDKPDSESQP